MMLWGREGLSAQEVGQHKPDLGQWSRMTSKSRNISKFFQERSNCSRTLQQLWSSNENHLDWTSTDRWSVGPDGRCILQICRAPHCRWLKTETNTFFRSITKIDDIKRSHDGKTTWIFLIKTTWAEVLFICLSHKQVLRWRRKLRSSVSCPKNPLTFLTIVSKDEKWKKTLVLDQDQLKLVHIKHFKAVIPMCVCVSYRLSGSSVLLVTAALKGCSASCWSPCRTPWSCCSRSRCWSGRDRSDLPSLQIQTFLSLWWWLSGSPSIVPAGPLAQKKHTTPAVTFTLWTSECCEK